MAVGALVDRGRGNGGPRESALGIVICHGEAVPGRPSAVAFVWGRREKKHPSIPFGKWREWGEPSGDDA